MMPGLTFENLLAWTAQVSVVVLAGAVLSKIFPIHQPRFYLVYCYTLLVACIALPVVQPARQPAGPLSLAVLEQPAPSASTIAAAIAQELTFLRPLLGWIVVAGIVMKFGFFIAGALRIRHYRKTAIPLHFPKESILSVCRLLNSDVEIGVSANEAGPVTFGWIRPMILLPASFLSLGEEAQHAILCHELLHVVRRDWLSNVIEEVIGACFWFHPGIWWILSETRLAREQVVDAEVVRLTAARDFYIEALLAIADACDERGLMPAPSFLRRRHLTTRMRTLLQDERTTGPRLLLSCASISAVLICGAWLAVRAFPLTAGQVVEKPFMASLAVDEAPKVSSIEDGVTPPRVTRYVTPEYSDAARRAKIEGIVMAEAIIHADGTVGSISVRRSLDPDLDRNAVFALQQWRFEPARRHGVAVEVTLFIEVNFQVRPYSASSM